MEDWSAQRFVACRVRSARPCRSNNHIDKSLLASVTRLIYKKPFSKHAPGRIIAPGFLYAHPWPSSYAPSFRDAEAKRRRPVLHRASCLTVAPDDHHIILAGLGRHVGGRDFLFPPCYFPCSGPVISDRSAGFTGLSEAFAFRAPPFTGIYRARTPAVPLSRYRDC